MIFTETEQTRLWKGDFVDVNGKRYKLCPGCHRALRVDGFFGTLHLCSREEDREKNAAEFYKTQQNLLKNHDS